MNFKSDVSEKNKKDQKNAIWNIEKLFNLQEKVTNAFRDYSLLLSEAKYKAKHGKGLKILTPKQMLQRLPTALAKVKADNTSENLLNEICQITYSLYQAK